MTDVYTFNGLTDYMDGDELSQEELAFMEGYLAA